MPYARHETEQFTGEMAVLRQKDKTTHDKLEKICERIISAPFNYDSTLKGPRSGQLKKKAIEERWRIVYRFCAYCLKVFKKKCNGCDLPNNAVVFVEVFHRDEGY